MAQRAGEDATPEPPSPDWADRLTDIGDAATKAGFAYSAFAGVVNSLQDDSLSSIEKLQALIVGLSLGLPAAISGFKSLKSIFESGGLVGRGIFGLGAGGSAAITSAAIAAIILALKTLINAIDRISKYDDYINQQTISLKNNLSEIRSQTTELTANLKELSNAQSSLEGLTKGTQEWRNAVQDVNSQILELIDKYPELAEYVTTANGVMSISAYGQNKVLDLQRQKLQEAQSAANIASIAQYNRQLQK